MTAAGMSNRERAMAFVGLAISYFVMAKIGLEFASDNPSATSIWAPSGIAVAAVLLGGPRLAPAVWLAAFAANITTASTPLLASAGIATGNTLEALAALAMLTLAGFSLRFDLRDVLALSGAALLATMVSATIGPLTLVLTTPLAISGAWDVASVWWMGDALGVLLVAPAIILYFTRHRLLPPLILAVAFCFSAYISLSNLSTRVLVTFVIIGLALIIQQHQGRSAT